MRTRPLRMPRITWPVRRGSKKQLHIWNPRPRFAYSLYNFYWATIKGRFLSSPLMLKPFACDKNSIPSKWGPKWRFWGNGVETLDYGFATPKRHFLARLTYFASKSVHASTIAFLKNQKNSRVTVPRSAKSRMHRTDLDKSLHNCRYYRHSYLHKFWWPSVNEFLGGGGSNFPLSHWLSSSPLQHSRTTVRACDKPPLHALALWVLLVVLFPLFSFGSVRQIKPTYKCQLLSAR